MARGRFHGIYPILYAFFGPDGRLDRHAMARQVEACVANGAHGIAILGIATEFAKLDKGERIQLMEWVAEDLKGRLPLAVTINEPSIHGQIEVLKIAESVGADWVILQPPAFKNVPESEYVRFLGTVAEAASVPVAIQNNPVNLDVWLTNASLKALHRNHANITLLKGEGPVLVVKRMIEETDGVFDVFNGLGGRELPSSLRAGCIGTIPAPDVFDVQARIYDLLREGSAESAAQAEALHRDILPLLTFTQANPAQYLCYGKLLFARRLGLAEVHHRTPAVQPNAFGLEVLEQYSRDLGALK